MDEVCMVNLLLTDCKKKKITGMNSNHKKIQRAQKTQNLHNDRQRERTFLAVNANMNTKKP